MQTSARRLLPLMTALLAIALFLSACNLSSTPSPGTPGTRAISTPGSTSAVSAQSQVTQGTPATTPATAAPAASSGPVGNQALTTPQPPAQAPGWDTIVQVAQTLRPSVVHIQINGVQPGFLNQPVPVQGVGTGIIVDTEGNILTNNHVVENANKITVGTANGKTYDAKIVGADPATDLAVIRVDATDLTPARLGDSSKLVVGQLVVAMGHALDLPGGPTVTHGVVGALDRTIQEDPQTTISGLIQTDAAINPGNSGGPLANAAAEVIGINTAGIQNSQGIGFAININDAKAVMTDLIAHGKVQRGFLGIVPADITAADAQGSGLPVDHGVGVLSVSRGGPAASAGLADGDIIIDIAGQPVDNTADLARVLAAHKPGETVDVTYYRGSSKKTATVTLGSGP